MRNDRSVVRGIVIATLAMGAGAFALGIGYLVTEEPNLALVAALAVMVLGAAIAQPALLPVLAMPILVVVVRVGGGGFDLTLSDLILGLVFWPALLLSPKPFSRELRQLLWLNLTYQAATLLTVVANPYLANAIEWLHAWMLVSGALVVGWAIGRAGYARVGLTLFLLACVALTIPTIIEGAMRWASGSFGPLYPAYPWPMHKNFIGTLLCFAAIVVYAHPTWMGWSRRWAMSAFWIFVAGIGFSQSRQALLGLGIAMVVISFRSAGERRRSVLALVSIVPALYLVVTLVRDQIASGNVHNSIFQRLSWFTDTLALWEQSPWFGHGLRYWTTDRTPLGFQPPNAFLEVLASAGLVGLAAFLVMVVGMLRVLWKLDPTYGTVAFALVLARLVQSQFDLFWIAITVSVPFALAGIALGTLALDRLETRVDVSPSSSGANSPADVGASA